MKVDLEEVKRRLLTGETYESIGDSYDVTIEAVRKWAKKLKLDGVGVKIRQQQKANAVGLTSVDLYLEYLSKYYSAKSIAKKKGKEFNFSFKEFVEKYCIKNKIDV